jgi:hypothetical protein
MSPWLRRFFSEMLFGKPGAPIDFIAWRKERQHPREDTRRQEEVDIHTYFWIYGDSTDPEIHGWERMYQ